MGGAPASSPARGRGSSIFVGSVGESSGRFLARRRADSLRGPWMGSGWASGGFPGSISWVLSWELVRAALCGSIRRRDQRGPQEPIRALARRAGAGPRTIPRAEACSRPLAGRKRRPRQRAWRNHACDVVVGRVGLAPRLGRAPAAQQGGWLGGPGWPGGANFCDAARLAACPAGAAASACGRAWPARGSKALVRGARLGAQPGLGGIDARRGVAAHTGRTTSLQIQNFPGSVILPTPTKSEFLTKGPRAPSLGR